MGKLYEHRELMDIIESKRDITWVEIGVRFGYNAEYVLKNFDVEKIYLIDPYVELDYDRVNFGNQNNIDNYKLTTIDKLNTYKDKVVWMEDFSYNTHQLISDDSVDILYIDGDHSYDGVYSDLDNYYSKVRSGGLIIGDDYNENGTEKAITNWSKDNDIEFKISHAKIGKGSGTDKFWFIK
jgi:predicted O-methyltransferase YrrM